MTPRHHPSEDLLAACAAGALRPGAALVVRAHLAFCAACRAEIGFFESLAGALLETEPAAELPAGALDRAFAAIDGSRPAPRRRRLARSPDAVVLPRGLDGLNVGRRRWMAPGVWKTPIETDRRSRELVYLLRIDRGMVLPRHTHSGSEFTCVLRGGFSDGAEDYALGDFIATDEAVEHSPIVDDEACITLASTDAPLVMRGLVGRLFQAFVRI
jgi:putative transcriptional regulator